MPAVGRESPLFAQDTMKIDVNMISSVFIWVFMCYSCSMKKYLILLALLSSSVFAQEVDEQGLFDLLKNIGMSDCEVFLQQGDLYSQASLEAASVSNWDAAFYHDENAFHAYLKAFGHCGDEPDNRQLALSRLELNQKNGDILSCEYHTSESHKASVRAQLALKHIEDSDQALRHAKSSIRSIDDALNFCSFDKERVKKLEEIRISGVKAVALIEYMIQVEKDGH